eukprot:g12597.t1
MRHFRDELRDRHRDVHYHELSRRKSDDRGTSFGEVLRKDVKKHSPDRLIIVEPGDFRVRRQLQDVADKLGIKLEVRTDRHFYCSADEFEAYAEGRKSLVLEYFYREMRRRHDVLIDDDGEPVGGRWNFDDANRESFGKDGPGSLPKRVSHRVDEVTRGVIELVEKRFSDHPGNLDAFDLPVTRRQARYALKRFVADILPEFGRWEDAMWSGEPFLYHSRLSAPLNLKLLSPRACVDAAVDAFHADAAPLNSVEGFVRQILGWREFVRGIYWSKMPEYAERNYFKHDAELPQFFWDGETDMRCVADAMRNVSHHGYSHHIQRLMVLGNLALLLGVHPYKFHEWHLAMYVDAVDWVSLPNALGMSQFGDGGVIGSKPYCSGGNYINNMSNYCGNCRFDYRERTGDNACPFTTLYWDFLAPLSAIAKRQVRKHDWPEWGGWGGKNNTPPGKNIPTFWDVKKGTNIKWKAKRAGGWWIQWSTPVIANGRVFLGANNGVGYVKRFTPRVDLGCLLCFDEKTGKFLWQHSNSRLLSGIVNDWPNTGIPSTACVDGDRLWYVTNRSEVVCLDTDGFHDGKNDGPYKDEDNENRDEADVIWKFDMMSKLGTFPHNASSCSVTCVGNILLVNTSNGVDRSHASLPRPQAPSFIALDRRTGKLLWTDNSPGKNVLHGQWSSPSVIVVNGKLQVLFAGGDGWLRSFDPNGDGKGESKLLWKFDCNPKDSRWKLGGQGTRNNVIATPVVYEGLIYLAVGQEPEHGEGQGHLYCIRPPRERDGRDVSPTLAVDAKGRPLPRRRIRAVDPKRGEKAIPNPKSAMIWHYGSLTVKEYEARKFERQMHRTIGNATIKNGILVIADFSGIVHCLDAKTGNFHWSYDMFAECWSTPLIVENKIYVGDADGDVAIFPLTRDPKKALRPDKNALNGNVPALGEVKTANSVFSSPVVANNVLFIANKNTLYAISAGGKPAAKECTTQSPACRRECTAPSACCCNTPTIRSQYVRRDRRRAVIQWQTPRKANVKWRQPEPKRRHSTLIVVEESRCLMRRFFVVPLFVILALTIGTTGPSQLATAEKPARAAQSSRVAKHYDATESALSAIAQHAVAPPLKAGQHDWPQWGGNSLRNNTPSAKNIPIIWDVKKGVNLKWRAKLGVQTYGTPIVANGRVYIASGQFPGYLKRFRFRIGNVHHPESTLLCFDEQTGTFLWQFSSPRKRPVPFQGYPSAFISGNPLVDGNRLWLVTNRFEVVCLDANGFRDGKNDGPYKDEPNTNRDEADVIWKLDMMKKLKVAPRGYCSRSVATDGKRLFVITGNGVDHTGSHVPNPDAPSFLCLDRDTGKVLWSDNSPGKNILLDQSASPTYFKIGKQAQVLFPGGDGWLYSFEPRGDGTGKAKLLWKFDCNPKASKWDPSGEGDRNSLVSYAVVEKNRVYIAVGQDPEHGEGDGHLYCIDPLKCLDGSDVSPTLAVDKAGKPIEPRRMQCVDTTRGEREIVNPRSAMVWHYTGQDRNGDGKVTEWEETMHRATGAPVIKDDILYIADFAGLLHCLDAQTGRQSWTFDLFASSWGTPVLVENKLYVVDNDGDVSIFPHTKDPKQALKKGNDGELVPALGVQKTNDSGWSTPVIANGVLFIASQSNLYAIEADKKAIPGKR